MNQSNSHAVINAAGGSPFRILQLTDFHSDAGEELAQRTYRDIRDMVRRFQPDLLAVTGDIWCGDDKPELAPAIMGQDLAFLGSLGVPWAFTWGNHDYVSNFEADRARIAATPNAVAPAGDGQGNFRVEVRGARGPAWDLYFLNSHTECLLPEDLAWFEAETARATGVPAIAYFHIPLEEYETARLENRIVGIAREEAAFWGNRAGRFETLRAAGTVRACFVGHSHVNDFHTVEDGVVLAYGRATGHGGYGGERLRKGAKLLELDLDSDRFRFKTVFADGTTWPTSGPQSPVSEGS